MSYHGIISRNPDSLQPFDCSTVVENGVESLGADCEEVGGEGVSLSEPSCRGYLPDYIPIDFKGLFYRGNIVHNKVNPSSSKAHGVEDRA